MTEIHFICRRGLNLQTIKHPVYESGFWDVSREDAERLAGGMVFLHETKSKPSYFGGRIDAFREVDTDMPHARRVIFRLTSLSEAKGVKWRGASHGMAWTSGVVET
jgi:hypothetical protein